MDAAAVTVTGAGRGMCSINIVAGLHETQSLTARSSVNP